MFLPWADGSASVHPRLHRPDCTGLCDAHWARSLTRLPVRRKFHGIVLVREQQSWKKPAFAQFLHWHWGADCLRPMLVISQRLLGGWGHREEKGTR